jgi:nucleoside-diphosphate-sugar epimerase
MLSGLGVGVWWARGQAAKKTESPILMTGAVGCIGFWVMARLTGAGRRTIGFDLSSDRRRLYLALPRDLVRPYQN